MTTAAIETLAPPKELEPDNATRLAIYDAMCDALTDGVGEAFLDDLYDRVIGRLRILVPRELHNTGERAYLSEKLAICVEASVLARCGEDRFALGSDPQAWIRFPDDSIRRYPHGLSAARERLDAINATLRDRRFDITKHIPHHTPSSPEFQALVRSMREHGFFKHEAIYRFADGTFVDGIARDEAARRAGVEVKFLELRQQDPETTRLRRRDTPLERVLLAVNGNAVRLSEDEQRHALDAAATAAGRTWDEIERYLEVTREWRSVIARSYTPVFEVAEAPFDHDGTRTIPVSDDHKVHVTTLLLASGLQKHKWPRELQEYVPTAEMARYKGGGPAGHFAPVADMLSGIQLMLKERRAENRKISPEWSICVDWLEEYVQQHRLTSRDN